MDRASQRFDQKRDIINRIRDCHRYRRERVRQEGKNKVEGNTSMELPQIVNTLSPTKNIVSPLSTTIQFKNNIQNQLDTIINETLSNFKNQKINKIIFTSPLAQRHTHTFYRHKDKQMLSFRPKYHTPKRLNTIQKYQNKTPPLSQSLTARIKELEHPYGFDYTSGNSVLQSLQAQRFSRYNGIEEQKERKKPQVREIRMSRPRNQKNNLPDRLGPWQDNQISVQQTI